MRRTNELVAHTTTQQQRRCLCEWFVANCALWNQHTYRRRQAYFDPDGDVWEAPTTDLYEDYAPVTGTATAQQVKRKNDDAWSSFFKELEGYHAGTRAEKPSPPGYWGNRRDGYDLRGLVRKDLYDIEGGDGTHSTLLFGVGDELKAKYGLDTNEQLSLSLQGNPRWRGEDCQLELVYDETADCIRVHHTVEVQPGYIQTLRQREFTHTPEQGNANVAAIDIGANNTLAVLTDSGHALVFEARDLFEQFRAASLYRARLQSMVPGDRSWSERLQRCCQTQYRRRDHHRDAALKHLADWLLAHGVTEVYVGDLSDVLSTHWVAEVNEKTHNFWSHGQLTDRLEETFDLAGIAVTKVDEGDTSRTCPQCGSGDDAVTRCGDTIHCGACGLEAHADLVGAGNILDREAQTSVSCLWLFRPRPMARPAAHDPGRAWDGDYDCTVTYLEWNDHEWRPTRTERAGTLGSLHDQRGVSKPASSQPGRWLAASPTEESPSL